MTKDDVSERVDFRMKALNRAGQLMVETYRNCVDEADVRCIASLVQHLGDAAIRMLESGVDRDDGAAKLQKAVDEADGYLSRFL